MKSVLAVLGLLLCGKAGAAKTAKVIVQNEQHQDLLDSYDSRSLFEVVYTDDPGTPSYDLSLYPSKESLEIKSPTGTDYICHIPQTDTADANEGSKNPYSAFDVDKLLQKLEGLCFYKIDGWWTYEFCYNKQLRQFHQDPQSYMDYSLGIYDEQTNLNTAKDGTDDRIVQDPGQKTYFRQVFGKGTSCDLNERPRSAEIHFVCGSDAVNHIYSIREPSTCLYELVFVTPYLCKHPMFTPEERPVFPIICEPKPASTDDVPPEAATSDDASSSSTGDQQSDGDPVRESNHSPSSHSTSTDHRAEAGLAGSSTNEEANTVNSNEGDDSRERTSSSDSASEDNSGSSSSNGGGGLRGSGSDGNSIEKEEL